MGENRLRDTVVFLQTKKQTEKNMENNKNMNPVFSLKNFRSFGEDGADFELAPITVLTGCNSAGKSSLVKALMLLSSGAEGDRYMENLKLSSKDLCLGGYKNVAHKDGHIIMSYTIWSADLQDTLVVTRKYCAQRNDELNDGDLDYITVEKSDGTLIYKGGNQYSGNEQHDDAIKDEFNRFYAVGCYMRLMELLPILEEWKKDKSIGNESLQDKVKLCEEAVRIVKENLRSVGLGESDAAMLWKEFDHHAFYTVVKAEDIAFDRGSTVSVSDLMKTPDEHEMHIMLQEFIDHIVNVACSPFFTQQPIYINSASAQIERLYTVSDENKMCKALRELNSRKIQYHNIPPDLFYSPCVFHKPGDFLDKWIDKFKIGKSVEVRGTDQGLGLMAYLTNDKKEERLLADEGYGITQLVALLLQIDNCIPIELECEDDAYFKEKKLVFNYKPRTICVEEPEIHLHPKYQSLLAEMFVEAYQKYNIHFVIETHSEYLIRKLQVMVADKGIELPPNDVSINYVEKDENGISNNRKIEIDGEGRLNGSFGEGFFDEAGSLSRKLFSLNK